jgi:ABC-type polysaccharide/polyol phosphate transport system ATPase subunit
MTPPPPIVRARDLSICYRMANQRIPSLKEYVIARLRRKISHRDFWALRGVSFDLPRGEVLGIVGHNGAGKSTLLKLVARILLPTSGTIEVNGRVVPMLELGSGFDGELSGRENIFLNGAILGYSKSFLQSKYDEILAFSELHDFIEVPVRNYSSGMKMRLAFSIATLVRPEILIVDEILSVGDAPFRAKSQARMMELMHGGTTVLFVSHSLEQIRQLCTRVLWLDHGRAKMCGPTKDVCDAYQASLPPPPPTSRPPSPAPKTPPAR